jgi:uncharacterized protein YbjT (DUF2867 family)
MEITVTAPMLVTGGTGTLGRALVPLLRAAGREVRVLGRSGPIVADLSTGAGVDAAVSGMDTVVHLAGTAKGDELKARTLVRAASRAGVRHLVFISVVGADRVPVVTAVDRAGFGYFAQKRAAEELIAGSGIPWTTLRASQLFDTVRTVSQSMAKLPVIVVPAGVRFQPVDTGEVAARLAELALGEPAGLVPDMAGPRIYPMGEMVRAYLTSVGRHRPILSVRFAGGAYRAIRDGANLAPDRAVGSRTWEEFLPTAAPETAAAPE